mmetsp:Transcript_27946/g.61558  ORF Transcript_27946/g.61558 Transcript_27946/m.61558 type:complete len:285 (-) Transcript_27946:785-1639(-)
MCFSSSILELNLFQSLRNLLQKKLHLKTYPTLPNYCGHQSNRLMLTAPRNSSSLHLFLLFLNKGNDFYLSCWNNLIYLLHRMMIRCLTSTAFRGYMYQHLPYQYQKRVTFSAQFFHCPHYSYWRSKTFYNNHQTLASCIGNFDHLKASVVLPHSNHLFFRLQYDFSLLLISLFQELLLLGLSLWLPFVLFLPLTFGFLNLPFLSLLRLIVFSPPNSPLLLAPLFLILLWLWLPFFFVPPPTPLRQVPRVMLLPRLPFFFFPPPASLLLMTFPLPLLLPLLLFAC